MIITLYDSIGELPAYGVVQDIITLSTEIEVVGAAGIVGIWAARIVTV